MDELISSLAISCGIIFSTSDQQIERFSRLCLDTLLALVELSPPTPLLFDELSTGLKAISDDFVRCDQRKVEAQESLREAIVKLNDALDEADTLRAEVKQLIRLKESTTFIKFYYCIFKFRVDSILLSSCLCKYA